MVFTIGSYLPGSSILHRFDPRLKLISIILITISVLIVQSAAAYLLLIGLMLIGAAYSKIPLKAFLSQIKLWGWLLILTVLLHIAFTKGTPIFTIFGFDISDEGLIGGFVFGLRFLVFILSAFLLTITTSPYDFADGFSSLMRPLKIIKIPVEDLSLVISIAFRFIPVIFEEASDIKTAQEARGVDFSKSSILKPKRFIALLVPLLYSVFRKADDLAEALIVRNYKPGAKRSSLYSKGISLLDILLFSVIIIVCLLILLIW